MKNIFINKLILLIAFCGSVALMSSCDYREVGDTSWPDQKVYMPTATYNNYMIDFVPAARGYDPTPGYPTRFLVDTVTRKFNVLLGAYRAGVDNKGTFTVNIAVNTDTINQLLAVDGSLPAGTELLPSDAYTVPEKVQVNDGSDIGKFDLSVDLDYLLSNYSATGKTYAIAVAISCSEREVNEKFATTIIVINTKIMKPVASFTAAESTAQADTLTMNFTNTSKFGTKFTWNFGDGSPVMVTTNAKNEAVRHKYPTVGTYPVTLTVQGVADFAQSNSVQTANVQVNGI